MAENTITRVIRWTVISALFVIPFISIIPGIAIANGLFFPFITGKNFAFRILVEIAFVGWALLALVDKQYRPKFSWPAVLFGAFVIWMAIADAVAVNPAKAFWSNYERMDGWVTLAHLLLFFLALTTLTATKLWRRWWLAFVANAALLCAYSVLQISHVLAIHQGSTRVDATIGNSAYLAAYLLFAFALTLWLAFDTDKKQKWVRYTLFGLAAVEVIILLYTETRGAILGFIGAVVLGSILWMFEAGKKGRKAAAGVLISILVLTGIFMMVRHEPWVQKLPAFGRLASISLSDPETTARFHIWNMAYQGFLERPIAGWGQEGFNYVFNQYYTPNLYGQEPWFDRAHDIYLDWLIAGGAPALLLFLAFMVTTVWGVYRSKLPRTERVLIISALGAYAFQGLFVFDNLFTYMPLIAVLAMAHAAFAKPAPQIEKLKEVSGDQFTLIAVPIGVVALLALIWFVNVPSMRAASDLIGGLTPASDLNVNIEAFKKAYADGGFGEQEITEQLMSGLSSVVRNQNIPVADRQAYVNYAIQQMDALVNRIPKDARIRIEYAYGLRSLGDYKGALTQVAAAEQLSPKKQTILIEEGVEQWQSGNIPAANAAFQKAYQLDPSFDSLAPYAAAGQIAVGNLAAGKALLMKTVGTTTVDSDIILLAYYTAKDYPDFINVWRLRVENQNRSAESEFGLAAALANAGQFAEARVWLQTAIKEHPEYATQGAEFLKQIDSAQGKK